MSQNDYTIANQTTPLFRADLNNAIQALASNSSGPTAPTTTYANMTWYDTGTNTLYMRSEADDAWIALGTLNQGTNTFTPAGLTNLTQAQAEDDASTVFGQVSGQRLAQAVAAAVDYGAGNAALAEGAVGTYTFASTSNDTNFGATVAGSTLLATSAARGLSNGSNFASGSFNSVGGLLGTWRCMARFDSIVTSSNNSNITGATLWLRIA